MNLAAIMNAPKPEEKSFELAPDGVYLGRIDKAEIKTSKSSGKEYISFMINLRDAEGKNKGNVFWYMFDSDSEFILYKNACFLKALGFPAEGDLALDVIATACEKQELTVNVAAKENEWNGQKRTRLEVVEPSGNPFMFDVPSKFAEWDAIVNKGMAPSVDDSFMNIAEDSGEESEF